MNGLTDIFYDVVDSAVSKECKRLSSSLFSEDYLNELTTNQEKALFKLFRNIASLSVKFEKGVAEYSPGIILYGEGRTFDLSDMTEEDYSLLSSVNVKSLPTLIRARVSNILWNEKKDFSMVEVAGKRSTDQETDGSDHRISGLPILGRNNDGAAGSTDGESHVHLERCGTYGNAERRSRKMCTGKGRQSVQIYAGSDG